MRTLLITDLHLAHKPLGLLEAQKKCILRIFEEEAPDEVIIMGDLVMVRRPRPVVLDALNDIIKTIKAKSSLTILRGNHDSDNRSDDGLTILSLFEDVNVKVITQTWHDHKNKRTFIPHYEDEEKIKKDLLEVPRGYTAFGHFGYCGSLNSAGDNDFSLSLSDFSNPTFLGHIHRYHKEGSITILGTPYSTNFGESDKKNYYAILEDNKATYKQILHGPRYLSVDNSDLMQRLDEINDENYFTSLRVNLSAGETQPTEDNLNVEYLDVKFKPAFDEESLSEYRPQRDLFTLNEVILEDYIDGANTDLPKDQIMRGLRLLRDEH